MSYLVTRDGRRVDRLKRSELVELVGELHDSLEKSIKRAREAEQSVKEMMETAIKLRLHG